MAAAESPSTEPKFALAVYQGVAHGKVLGHAHQGVVHRRVAVGVIFTDNVTDYTGRLFVGLVVVVFQLAHGEENAAVHGLEAIPHVRQGASHDDAHGIIQIRAPYFLFYADVFLYARPCSAFIFLSPRRFFQAGWFTGEPDSALAGNQLADFIIIRA